MIYTKYIPYITLHKSILNKSYPYDANQTSMHRLCHRYSKLKRFHIRYAKTHRVLGAQYTYVYHSIQTNRRMCTIFPFLYIKLIINPLTHTYTYICEEQAAEDEEYGVI